MNTQTTFELTEAKNWTEIRQNGELVATVCKTQHPTDSFDVLMKNGTGKTKRVGTIGEAAKFILENLK